MAYFNRDTSNRGGRDNRGGGRGFGGGRPARNDGPREMFKTVCSSCGKECEVPFKPTNGKPVYCSECFDRISPRTDRPERSERSERPSFDRNDRPRRDDRPQTPRVDYGAQFEALNAKMDKLITLLTPKVEEKKSDTETSSVLAEAKPAKVAKVKKAKVVKEVE
jgi:CxxC-x17-CxxC domain-containing protein